MSRGFLLVFIVLGVAIAHQNELLQVPSPVMDFILGCERNLRAPKIPVARTEVDPATGTLTEQINLMDLTQLRSSLAKSFDSGSVVDHIITEIENSLTEQQTLSGRHACTQVTVAVPPQEVKNLDGQLQAVVQQNNNQLLQQINTLFSFKMNNLLDDIKKVVGTNKMPDKEILVAVPETPPADQQKEEKETAKETEVTENVETPIKTAAAEMSTAEENPVMAVDSEQKPDEAVATPDTTIPQRRNSFRKKVPSSQPKQSTEEVKEKDPPSVPGGRRRRLNDMLALRRQFLNRRRNGQ